MDEAGGGPDRAPTIAIVVVCYNQARFLDDALRSALSQSLVADDVILVDDGSTDDTAAVAAGYPSVRYLRQANAGLSAARNAGLASTSADFVLFLDSDDVLERGALASAAPALLRPSRRAFVYGGYREVSEDRTSFAVHPPVVTDTVFDDLLRMGNFIAMHGTVLYDAEILRVSGGFDVGLRSCEDFDVYLRLARAHPVGTYSSIAAEYRRHGESLSRDMLSMIETARSVLERHADDRSKRVAARQGMAAMTAYYGEQFWSAAIGRLSRREFRASLGILVPLIKRPRFWALLFGNVPLWNLQRRARRILRR